MKKLFVALVIGLSCLSMKAWADMSAPIGQNLVWEFVSEAGRLSIWPDYVGNLSPDPTETYILPDFSSRTDAPWYHVRDSIQTIAIYAPAYIGKYAFCDMPRFYYYLMIAGSNFGSVSPSYGDSVFWGCVNLKTVEARDPNPPVITNTTLVTSDTTMVEVIVVNNGYWDDVTSSMVESDATPYMFEATWACYADELNSCINERKIIVSEGCLQNETDPACYLTWRLSQSDTLMSLKLQISANYANYDGVSPLRINDFADNNMAPWSSVGRWIEDLHIDAPLEYVGAFAFSELWNLQTISFLNMHQRLNSMHYRAFFDGIRPWKWAFGDLDTQTKIPPAIVGYNPDGGDTVSYKYGSVLYVPDSLVESDYGPVHCIDLFRVAPYWKEFAVITDRTIKDSALSSTEVLFYWYPISWCASYDFTFRWSEGGVDKDTTITIYADGANGFMDVQKMIDKYGTISPSGSPFARKSVLDYGGSTLVINVGTMSLNISTNSGQKNNPAFEVTAKNLIPEQSYGYGMESKNQYGDVRKKSEGEAVTPKQSATGIDDVDAVYDGPIRIYDLQGRYVGNDESKLPAGIYIKAQNGKVEKLLITAY